MPRPEPAEGRFAARLATGGPGGRLDGTGGRAGEAGGKPAGRRHQLWRLVPDAAEVELPAEEIATLSLWVEQGAPWGIEPRAGSDPAASSQQVPAAGLGTSGEFRRRAGHWCFQPIRRPIPPAVGEKHAGWPRNPIDNFLLAALERRGLSPAPEADRRTLIRRLTFDLTGLPPGADEVASFLADASPDAYERLVERLLASPHYGERWGRHWLDLARFAETAGHEFDYELPNAFRYRDYVIRAFNADLPYDRFVIEQVAGDLLETPRRHPTERFNESIIGTGFAFLGEGTHSPVDVREEEARRIDNQIDVLSKTFLGLTLACARCHDHKFDPITSKDYYALAGFLRSSRHQQAFIDSPDRINPLVDRLKELKAAMRHLLDEAGPLLPGPLAKPVREAVTADREAGPVVRSVTNGTRTIVPASGNCSGPIFETFDRGTFDGWHVSGDAFGDIPTKAGGFRLDLSPSAAWLIPVRSGQAHSGLVSNRVQGVLRSRTFTIEHRYLQHLASGTGGRINVVIDGFEKIRDPIYGVLTLKVDVGDQPRWITQDVGMWLGHRAYIEIADGATADYNGAQTQLSGGDGLIAVDEIRMSDRRDTPPPPRIEPGPIKLDEVLSALRTSSSSLAHRLEAIIQECRAIESAIPEPILALAIADGTGEDARILIRGNHNNPGKMVPRRFPEVLGGVNQTTPATGSGRLELARRMVDPRSNPLLPRVMVNRLWKHHFGEGIVKTTDDFGAMGQKPSHPELLDWLAAEFVARGWSVKAMHRLLVTSSAYRMSSAPQGESERLDPSNVALHRMNVRRLEAEAIRDALLAVSGRLDPTMFGPSVPVYLSEFMEGRGRPKRSGPLDGDGRRSIYLGVRRNFLNPMSLAFDAPVPFSTMGRRNVSNVPAQALALMNDPLVIELAGVWADRVLARSATTDRERIDRLFQAAFSRPPSDQEARDCLTFLHDRPKAAGTTKARDAWADLCHVLINVKEFIYIQ
jgi:hypothetical protein